MTVGESTIDLASFAEEIGPTGPVAVEGGRTQWDVGGQPDPSVRLVRAPAGIAEIAADEMTVCCGAGTLVTELDAALGRARAMRRAARVARRDGGRRPRGGAQRHPPSRVRAGTRHVAAGAVRVGRGTGREGGRTHREERQRLRPVPLARRVARHGRAHRRSDPAHATDSRRVSLVHRRNRRTLGARGGVVPARLGSLGWRAGVGVARGPPCRCGGLGLGVRASPDRCAARPAAASLVDLAHARSPRSRARSSSRWAWASCTTPSPNRLDRSTQSSRISARASGGCSIPSTDSTPAGMCSRHEARRRRH